MKPPRRHVAMRLRCDLVESLDEFVAGLRLHDDRVNRTEIVERAIRGMLADRDRRSRSA